MSEPTLIRIRRKKPGVIARYWWVVPLAAAVTLLASWAVRPRPGKQLLPGYISSAASLEQEYARYYGKPLENAALRREFRVAAERCSRGDYGAAAASLENLAKTAPLPLVFNNLGVLYAELRDRSRAVNAFRDALSRDIGYQPVRLNLSRLTELSAAAVEPVTRELESNDTYLSANVVALDRTVDAEIALGANDADCYRFVAAPEPRDLFALDLVNHSQTLAPMASFYDFDNRLMDWRPASRQPGSSLHFVFSPEPNVPLYVRVRGYADSGGRYALVIRPLKAYDAFEPNDDIRSARRIEIGRPVEANIMDARDSDFYSFIAPRSGAVTVEIRNRSKELAPALTMFNPEMRTTGFGPDVRTPGSSLKQEMEVSSGLVYFVQVWPIVDSAGEYSLTVR